MRDYNIKKYPNNTHYTVEVTDSYNQKHVSFFRTTEECSKYVYEVWESEVKKPKDLLADAIANMIEIDKKSGILKGNRDGLD